MADGQLRIRVVGDASKFQRTMDRTSQRLQKFGAVAAKGAKIAAAGMAAAGGAAVAGAFKVASFGDEVAKSAQKAGLGVEQFQELRFAFGQGGVEAATMDQALLKFNRRLGESATSGGEADEAFAALGVALRDADGNVRGAGEAMDEVLPKLAGIESDAERASVAGDLFGQRAGPELAAALSDGVGGIDEARQKAQDLGIVMGEDAAQKAEQFTDAWDDIKQSTLGALRTGLTPVMEWMADRAFPFIQDTLIPALERLREWLGPRLAAAGRLIAQVWGDHLQPALLAVAAWWSDHGPAIVAEAQEVGATVVAMAQRVAAWIGDTVVPVLARLGGWWSENGPTIIGHVQAVWGALQRFRDVVAAAVQVVIGWFQSSGEQTSETSQRMQSIWATLQSVTESVWNAIKVVVTRVINDVQRVVAGVTAAIRFVWERWGSDIKAFAQATWNAILRVIDGVLQVIGGIFDVFAGLFTGNWQRVWEGVKNIASGIWDVIAGLLEGMFAQLELAWTVFRDSFQEAWNATWTAVKDFASGIFDSVVGFVTDLPGRAQTALSSAWPTFWNWYTGIAEDIYNFLSGKGEDLIDWFGELPGKLADAMATLGSELRDMGREQWSNFTDWLGERGRALVDWFGDLPERIGNALGNLGSKIKDKFSFDLPGINFSGDGPGGFTGPGGGGPAAARAAQAAAGLPIVKTSGYRTPAQNRAAGGSPTSWHLDRSNPATDWAGPTWALDQFAARLRQMGGWRELLWRVPNHAPGDNPHVHVADEGATLDTGLNLLMNNTGRAEPLQRTDDLRPVLHELKDQIARLEQGLGRPNVTFVAGEDVRADAQMAKLALMR